MSSQAKDTSDGRETMPYRGLMKPLQGSTKPYGYTALDSAHKSHSAGWRRHILTVLDGTMPDGSLCSKECRADAQLSAPMDPPGEHKNPLPCLISFINRFCVVQEGGRKPARATCDFSIQRSAERGRGCAAGVAPFGMLWFVLAVSLEHFC